MKIPNPESRDKSEKLRQAKYVYTFQDLKTKIYNYTKKSIWHLAIWQKWRFGQSSKN
jgi:hypothetical protein